MIKKVSLDTIRRVHQDLEASEIIGERRDPFHMEVQAVWGTVTSMRCLLPLRRVGEGSVDFARAVMEDFEHMIGGTQSQS